VEKHLAALHEAEKAGLGEAILEAIRKELEVARVERDSALSPQKLQSRLRQKIQAKEASLGKALEAVEWHRAELEKATEQVGTWQQELEKLQGELRNVQPEDDEVSCDGEDESLEPEFRSNVEVVRLHRRLEAAKASAREDVGPTALGGSRGDEESLNFEGDDFDDMDLEELGIAAGGDLESRKAAKNKLAEFCQKGGSKKQRCREGGGVVRTCSKR
jgi:hypothetical protein